MQSNPRSGFVRVFVQMLNAIGVEGARPANDAVDFVAQAQQQLGQVRSILTGNSRDQGAVGGSRVGHEKWRGVVAAGNCEVT